MSVPSDAPDFIPPEQGPCQYERLNCHVGETGLRFMYLDNVLDQKIKVHDFLKLVNA